MGRALELAASSRSSVLAVVRLVNRLAFNIFSNLSHGGGPCDPLPALPLVLLVWSRGDGHGHTTESDDVRSADKIDTCGLFPCRSLLAIGPPGLRDGEPS